MSRSQERSSSGGSLKWLERGRRGVSIEELAQSGTGSSDLERRRRCIAGHQLDGAITRRVEGRTAVEGSSQERERTLSRQATVEGDGRGARPIVRRWRKCEATAAWNEGWTCRGMP